MKLADLDPTFVGDFSPATPAERESHRQLGAAVDGAQGIMFVCPKCGNHQILCWFKNPRNAPMVPADVKPGPGRWTFSGDTFDTLTLLPSVDLSTVTADNPRHPSRCYWHGFVTSGEIR